MTKGVDMGSKRILFVLGISICTILVSCDNQITQSNTSSHKNISAYMEEDPSNYQDCGNLTTEGCKLDEGSVTAPSPDNGYNGDFGGTTGVPQYKSDDPIDHGGGEGSGTSYNGSGSSDRGDAPCEDPVHECEKNSDIYITSNPEFHYPIGSDYAKDYKKFTEYLKNEMPKLKDNDKIINAIKKYTSLSKDEIVNDLKWGKGPVIKITRLEELDKCPECDKNTVGSYFQKSRPNILYIDSDWVRKLEATSPGSKLNDSFTFFMSVTVLHEYVHYGDFITGIDYPGEEGELFERDAYGQVVNIDQEGNIILNNK